MVRIQAPRTQKAGTRDAINSGRDFILITDMYKYKPAAGDSPEQQRTEPVEREYVKELQRRADKLADSSAPAGGGQALARHTHHEQQQIEQEMAELRSRAVQARRLAEHIEGLSGSPAPSQWTETTATTVDTQGKRDKTESRRKNDAPAASPRQRSFNPLHPSMELPPEQLIRLLGLQTRKNRKRKKPNTSQQSETAKPAVTDKAATDMLETRPTENKSEKPVSLPAFDEPRRRGLLLPATIAGILLGAGVSAWLFLNQQDVQQTSSPTFSAQVEPPAAPAEKPAQAIPPAPETTPTLATPPAQKSPSVSTQRSDRAWREAILEQRTRLYSEAQQRFDAQLNSMQTGQEKPVQKIHPDNRARVDTALPQTPAAGTVAAEKAILEQVIVHYSITGSASVADDTPLSDLPVPAASIDSAPAAESAGPESTR